MRLCAPFVPSLVLAMFAVLAGLPAAAFAQSEPCHTRANGLRPAITAADAIRWARGEALAGDLDSMLTRLMTTGTIDAEGQSTGWMVELFSTEGKRLRVVNFDDGKMTCATHAFEGTMMAGQFDESNATILDLSRLIAIAREATNPPPDLKTLKVTASLQRNADDTAARWSISFVDQQGYPKGQVTIDAVTGAVAGK